MRMSPTWCRGTATLGLLIALALAGSMAGAQGGAPGVSGTITFAIPAEPLTVDPAIEVA